MIITSMDQLQSLVRAGFSDWQEVEGEVSVRYYSGMVQFNYTQAAMFADRWNWFECVSRGLIIDATTGEIVAYPFDKFFNFGQGERYPTTLEIKEVTEKRDGSMGILYWLNETPFIATRGSFESDQALWASQYLLENCRQLEQLPENVTVIFEIVYPENRIVIDYGDERSLTLLAMRNNSYPYTYLPRETLEYYATLCHFKLPQVYNFASVQDIINVLPNLPATEEGYVVEFADGSRFKLKGETYKALHILANSLSMKTVLDIVISGNYDTWIEGVPDEFLGMVLAWKRSIDNYVYTLQEELVAILPTIPSTSRKDAAQYIMRNYKPYSKYLFKLLDGQDITLLILQEYRRNYKDYQEVE